MSTSIITKCLLGYSSFSSLTCHTLTSTLVCQLSSRAGHHLYSKPSKGLSKLPFQTVQAAVSLTGTKVGLDQQSRGIAADTQTTALTIWKDLKQMRFSPLPALVLGFSGLIPFVGPPVYMIGTQLFCSSLAMAQTAYGACILSFLGGVRWGFALPEGGEARGVGTDWFNLGYSVTPPLVAWVALLMPPPLSVLAVMGGVAGSAYFDTAVRGYPPWFKGLRFTLSLVAVLSLWSVFLCQYMLTDSCTSRLAAQTEENESS